MREIDISEAVDRILYEYNFEHIQAATKDPRLFYTEDKEEVIVDGRLLGEVNISKAKWLLGKYSFREIYRLNRNGLRSARIGSDDLLSVSTGFSFLQDADLSDGAIEFTPLDSSLKLHYGIQVADNVLRIIDNAEFT